MVRSIFNTNGIPYWDMDVTELTFVKQNVLQRRLSKLMNPPTADKIQQIGATLDWFKNFAQLTLEKQTLLWSFGWDDSGNNRQACEKR